MSLLDLLVRLDAALADTCRSVEGCDFAACIDLGSGLLAGRPAGGALSEMQADRFAAAATAALGLDAARQLAAGLSGRPGGGDLQEVVVLGEGMTHVVTRLPGIGRIGLWLALSGAAAPDAALAAARRAGADLAAGAGA